MERPSTSKPRGVCKFHLTTRGCRHGDACKFLHGSESHTGFDKSKYCRFYAAGYCKHGDKCWFRHEVPPGTSALANVEDVQTQTPAEDTSSTEEHCGICYEKPVTFGLLNSCSHIFCLQCLRDWRDPGGKSEEIVQSGNTKKCPFCRVPSRYVIPSSRYFPSGHPMKREIVDKYKDSMARVPCKYFERSPPHRRFCPYGRDCFYRHQNADGTLYTFERGAMYYMSLPRNRRSGMNNFGMPGGIPAELLEALDIRTTMATIRNNLEAMLASDGFMGNSDGATMAPDQMNRLAEDLVSLRTALEPNASRLTETRPSMAQETILPLTRSAMVLAETVDGMEWGTHSPPLTPRSAPELSNPEPSPVGGNANHPDATFRVTATTSMRDGRLIVDPPDYFSDDGSDEDEDEDDRSTIDFVLSSPLTPSSMYPEPARSQTSASEHDAEPSFPSLHIPPPALEPRSPPPITQPHPEPEDPHIDDSECPVDSQPTGRANHEVDTAAAPVRIQSPKPSHSRRARTPSTAQEANHRSSCAPQTSRQVRADQGFLTDGRGRVIWTVDHESGGVDQHWNPPRQRGHHHVPSSPTTAATAPASPRLGIDYVRPLSRAFSDTDANVPSHLDDVESSNIEEELNVAETEEPQSITPSSPPAGGSDSPPITTRALPQAPSATERLSVFQSLHRVFELAFNTGAGTREF
ncbi:hypothetical protein BD410DRAFT_787234 [Rickenella mellea]|uniref:RING-type E3 ubiquitin transferase n=1 Tax=Rickenella mellea TaxID=50990 RepID=A0A4Y7Q972_9AGAM|nr:hypothetical protein BD410DRAFT_787234 [Rickenella mellea]